VCHPAPVALLPDLLPARPVELRRWRTAYTAALTVAVASSLPELRPWMPWAQEPPTVTGTTQVLTQGDIDFAADEVWQFVVVEPGSDRILGAAGLHRRGPPDTVEIGYWIRTDATRRGLATIASRTLTTAAFAHLPDVATVEIRMDSLNARSAAVPPRLGFRLEGEVDQPVDAPGQSGRWLVWTMARADWAPDHG
jgi:RimJ/RimL family protein N-acetyltransferase